MKHRQREVELGDEIWPAAPEHLVSEKSKEEIDFCANLDCASEQKDLEW